MDKEHQEVVGALVESLGQQIGKGELVVEKYSVDSPLAAVTEAPMYGRPSGETKVSWSKPRSSSDSELTFTIKVRRRA